MNCRTQFIQNVRSDKLMPAKLRPTVHNPMAYCHGSDRNVLPDRGSNNAERLTLRFVNTLLLNQQLSVGGANVQGAITLSNPVGAPGQQRPFVSAFAVT